MRLGHDVEVCLVSLRRSVWLKFRKDRGKLKDMVSRRQQRTSYQKVLQTILTKISFSLSGMPLLLETTGRCCDLTCFKRNIWTTGLKMDVNIGNRTVRRLFQPFK